jgi:hypothetical protein
MFSVFSSGSFKGAITPGAIFPEATGPGAIPPGVITFRAIARDAMMPCTMAPTSALWDIDKRFFGVPALKWRYKRTVNQEKLLLEVD